MVNNNLINNLLNFSNKTLLKNYILNLNQESINNVWEFLASTQLDPIIVSYLKSNKFTTDDHVSRFFFNLQLYSFSKKYEYQYFLLIKECFNGPQSCDYTRWYGDYNSIHLFCQTNYNIQVFKYLLDIGVDFSQNPDKNTGIVPIDYIESQYCLDLIKNRKDKENYEI